MRTPRWVSHAYAVSSGLVKLVSVVTLIGAMVALEFVTARAARATVPDARP